MKKWLAILSFIASLGVAAIGLTSTYMGAALYSPSGEFVGRSCNPRPFRFRLVDKADRNISFVVYRGTLVISYCRSVQSPGDLIFRRRVVAGFGYDATIEGLLGCVRVLTLDGLPTMKLPPPPRLQGFGLRRTVLIPLWFTYGLLLILPLNVFVLTPLRQFRRATAGHCHDCGYDLTGAIHPRCPECGTERKNCPT